MINNQNPASRVHSTEVFPRKKLESDEKSMKYMAKILWNSAKLLDDATTSVDFLKAISFNAAVWKIIQRRAAECGWAAPFPTSGSLAARLFAAKRGLSDQDVATIISINRQLSLRLRKTDTPQ